MQSAIIMRQNDNSDSDNNVGNMIINIIILKPYFSPRHTYMHTRPAPKGFFYCWRCVIA